MIIVVAQLVGVVLFFAGTLTLGARLRKCPTLAVARQTSLISHGLFHAGLLIPVVVGAFCPGLRQFDVILNWPALPAALWWKVVGGIVLIVGLAFALASHAALALLGNGAASFILSNCVVAGSVYRCVRNPLALGWYLTWLGLAWLGGSTYLTLYLLLAHIPAHIFFLKHFEELELSIRFGDRYQQYKQSVPFLIPGWRATP